MFPSTVDRFFSTVQDMDVLDDVFALSRFWRWAIYPNGYTADESWGSIVVPTEAAEPVMAAIRNARQGLSDADTVLALYCMFYYRDILIDWSRSDRAGIQALLHGELIGERIRLPHRYGRVLYDRYNSSEAREDAGVLKGTGLKRLLAGTPQGVHQVGRYVSGPLGILVSVDTRYVPPAKKLPLWHCADTGCMEVHEVELGQHGVLWRDALLDSIRALAPKLGPRSKWGGRLAYRSLNGKWPTGREYADILAILGDCIIGKERSTLLGLAIRSPGGRVIQAALSSIRNERAGKNLSPESVSESLSPESQLQLMLLLDDNDIVSLVDNAVSARKINVHLGEVRLPRVVTGLGHNGVGSSLSTLGLRSCRGTPLVSFISIVFRAYASGNMLGDLTWKLRANSSEPIVRALMKYVWDKEPGDVVESLVLPNEDVTKFICEDRRIPLEAASDPKAFASKLLWKLGYNPPQFGDFELRFMSRLQEFKQALLSNTPVQTEDHRASIRSAGVNLFVSVEEFLETLLAYNVWVLASDHFVSTRFRFDSHAALPVVAAVLGPSLGGEDVTLEWNGHGGNTLGVSLRYLEEASSWMSGLATALDRDAMLRPKEDLPFFAKDVRYIFPFRHTALWADSEPSFLTRHAEVFAKAVKLLSQSRSAAIRNGLDHKRAESTFPDGNEMIACAARLQEAFEIVDANRLYPKAFWVKSVQNFSGGSYECKSVDYAGRSETFVGPGLASGTRTVGFQHPFLICPGDLIGSTGSKIFFRPSFSNEYTRYWNGYPKRRRLPVMEDPGSSGDMEMAKDSGEATPESFAPEEISGN